VDAAPEALEKLPLGPPLPALRDGMILRQDTSAASGPRQGSPNAADAPGVPPSGATPWPANPGLPGVYRLQDGRRIRLGDAGNASLLDGSADVGLTVEAAVLQTIPPALLDGTLIKGAGLDIYHVTGGSLRKIPDWRWATERGLRPQATIYVPDRLLATLPQNSPEWVMPGGTWQDRVFHSESLGRPMPYRVYLPPGYNRATEAARRYPVLYLLHGTSGRYEEWSGYGLEEVTNELLAEGRMPEVILVLPQGGLGYWLNQVGPGGTRWGDYVARDLVRHVDATYRTLAQREARAIGGLSMGGHGALQLALNYADVFGIAGGHSPSLRARDAALAYFGDDGEFDRRDPISLVKESQLAKPPLIWIDTGADDPWLLRLGELHEALQQRGWAHERHVYPGEHDGWYWGDHLWDYLPFYASSFGRLGVPLSGPPR
ncbi:MAG TPA: alpha/beta hydrolase-fold protein, partial [Chloroflexota bacterium]|nr:alpha/beta hydrolase-fold protein [Chloroflexota bacterium]